MQMSKSPIISGSIVTTRPFSLPCKYLQGSENGRVVTIDFWLCLFLRNSRRKSGEGKMNGTVITNQLQNSIKIKDNNVYGSSYYWNFRTSSFKQVARLILLTDKLSFEGDREGSDHCACLTGSDRKRPCPEVTWLFALLFSPYFPVLFFPILFFRTFFPPYFFSRTFSNYFVPVFFPVLFSPYSFSPVLFPMSRRLKSNVLKYQLVVFLEHVVIAQFMFLAEYPFKRHP